MADDTLYPLLLNPTLHVKVWGGRRLESALGKRLPTPDPYGESWELHDTATVAAGPLAGRALGALLAERGAALVGPGHDPAAGFPLLAKLIDASEWLSVQVHPNNAQARALEGQPRGKTEAWYILAAEPGAQLVIGVQPGTSREQMAQAIRAGALERLLVYADVAAGDAVFIPAGTVHAIGGGILLYEIQQSSDTTYRLYDWGRLDLDGRPRTLHIEKGVQVANLDSLPQLVRTANAAGPVVEIARSAYFAARLYRLAAGSARLDTEGVRFHALTCVNGAARLAWTSGNIALEAGQTVLVPACIGPYRLDGRAQVLCAHPA
ncbi:MAG: type I phosphomannose isomerase catalytic subunit [Aggregatilineales bacterium]